MEEPRRDEAMRVGEDRDRNTWRGRGRDGEGKAQGGSRDKGEKGPGTGREMECLEESQVHGDTEL